jgi:zinc finger SWIM domain-containing protein 3
VEDSVRTGAGNCPEFAFILQSLVILLSGAVVEVIADKNGLVNGIYFQDDVMRRMFEKFPELFMIDATYKLNELRLPLFIIMPNVDGNGASEIVALWIVSDEGRHTVTEMIKIFKRCNENWSKIRCIMSDKDFGERNFLSEHIPGFPLLICLFYVLKAFKGARLLLKNSVLPRMNDSLH